MQQPVEKFFKYKILCFSFTYGKIYAKIAETIKITENYPPACRTYHLRQKKGKAMTDLSILSQKLNLLINLTEETIQNIRKQHFWKTSHNLYSFTASLKEFFTISMDVFDQTITSNLLSYLQDMLEAQTNCNYVLLGDILEIHLLPSFYELQEAVLSNLSLPQKDFFTENIHLLSDKNCIDCQRVSKALNNWYQAVSDSFSSEAKFFAENYLIEPTNNGCLTLNKKQDGRFYYFHSNQNPQKEGKLFADSYGLDYIFHYTIAGMGLGYHITGLLQKDQRYNITILESDINILGAAFRYINLNYILTCTRARISYLPDFHQLGNFLSSENEELLIHYPTLLALKEGPVKDSLKNYFINLSTAHEQAQLLKENFYYNQQQKDESVDAIKSNFQDKHIIYIGGGPSAETKLENIKCYLSCYPDTIMICAGTVYRKLLSLNVIPDYVMISDSQNSLLRQLNNIPETRSTLIYLSTASCSAVKAFQGKKYIAYQSGFDASEQIAGQNNYTLFSTGGSVSTFAIDFAIRFGCKKLITVGLDLSFPQNKTHGFSLSADADTTFLSAPFTILDLHGNQIQTSQPLNSYRKWIEQRICTENAVEFINVTEGACIHGMKNMDNLLL